MVLKYARRIAKINARRIGMVVVYKIDRLTRSLATFGWLVKGLDAKGCSFVAVTQAFNTVTSMGRLTLNVICSSPRSNARSAPEDARCKGQDQGRAKVSPP
jgi:site-specific DNA recombinase